MARARKSVEGETVVTIYVTDKAGVFHEFKGTIRFWHDGPIARVWNTVTNTTLASFTDPLSIVVKGPEVVS